MSFIKEYFKLLGCIFLTSLFVLLITVLLIKLFVPGA